MKRENIAVTGTIRSDRKPFPIELKKKEKLVRGDHRYATCNGVSVIKWMDKKEVYVASNFFDPNTACKISRQNRDGSIMQISCSVAIAQYNKYMGGVDLSAQKIKYYAIDRKSTRNWLRIFFHFLNTSLSNSFIHYRYSSGSKMSALEYVSSISTTLIGDYYSRKSVRRSLAISDQKRRRIENNRSHLENFEKPQLLAHMPEVISGRRRCAYCSILKRKRKERVGFVLSTQLVFVWKTVFCCIMNAMCISYRKNEGLKHHGESRFSAQRRI